MKNCPFCGANIEDNAKFCLYCMQSLVEKEQILHHEKKKLQWLLLIAAFVGALLILMIALFHEKTTLRKGSSSESPLMNFTVHTKLTKNKPISSNEQTTTNSEQTMPDNTQPLTPDKTQTIIPGKPQSTTPEANWSSTPSDDQPTNASDNQPIKPTESQSTAPPESRPTTPTESQSTTPTESRPTTPTESQPTTPTESRPTTPTESQSTTPTESQSTTPTETQPTSPTIPATTEPHEHNFTEKNASSQYLKSEATCGSAATYYYSCLCGLPGLKVFYWGPSNDHNIVTEPGYPSDCVTPGLSDRKHCVICGLTTQSHSTLPVLGHTFRLGVSNATCLTCGTASTYTFYAPAFPFYLDNTFRFDSGSYNITPRSDGTWNIKFVFNYTNISSKTATFLGDISLQGVTGTSYTEKALDPNESGALIAETYVTNSSGTYTLVIK